MLLAGLFGAVLSASASVAREVRSGTALAVLSKPVSRAQFLLAKYLGVISALTLLTYVNILSALLASRMAFDAYGSPDMLSVGVFAGGLLLAYLIGGFSNYFLHRPFVSDAVFSLVTTVTLAFLLINCFNKEGQWQKFATGIDWRLVPAAILILFALWILAGLAIACSTRFELIPTLAICSGLFLLGLMSDYLFGRLAEAGSWWASALYTVVPNWQLFWLADALENKKSIPWSYVGRSFAYVLGYLGAVLAVALVMFEDRELT
jgi:ABC-type transport system involved in multi-copper enzyme maturation permease subunit